MNFVLADRKGFLTVVTTDLHHQSPEKLVFNLALNALLHSPEFYYILIWTGLGYNLMMTDFYTRQGDDGYTGLLQGGRVPKNHPIPEAVGALDEASAALGVARAACQAKLSADLILAAQRDLYSLMAEVAASPGNAAQFRRVDAEQVAWLENQADILREQVIVPKEFIVPGDSPAGAAIALARTIVRRAERQIAGLVHAKVVENAELLRYLNRLSSLCFILELHENQAWGKAAPTLARSIEEKR